MALPIILFLLIVFTYALVIFLFSAGIRKSTLPYPQENNPSAKVSIIIPFHRETENLTLLVRDLFDQSYPRSLYEVLLVDDHSEDTFSDLIKSMTSEEPGFSCLTMPQGSSGKKEALNFGIQSARYDRLIQVDADCRVGRDFLVSHMAFLEKHPSDLVAGLVLGAREKGGLLGAYERLDLMALAGSGVGSFALGRPMMCSGANLSYSRELYMETRRFDPVELTESGDDMFLMIGARKLRKTLAFNTDPEATVATAPARSFRQLLSQRIRWGAKSYYYGMADIQGLALLVSFANLGILLLPLWCILYTTLWPWLAGAWILKSLADLLLLFRISGISHQRDVLRWFLPVSLVYYPVFFISLLGALPGRSRWKRDN
jgi:cellulose synthase/poly-beta-1,6-N-acetylglucosamine synthase-like glycosyltransferase